MLSQYRSEWLSVRKNNLKATRKKLMGTNSFLYLWLRRNDSVWLEENLPPVEKISIIKNHLDWKKIDKELQSKVKKVIAQIRQEKRPLKRISITEIIKRVGYKNWLDKRNQKLPLTAKLIEENLESLEEFMLRKIQHTKNLYLKEKKLPTKLQFKVRAVVRNRTSIDSERIQKAIDQTMISLHSNYL